MGMDVSGRNPKHPDGEYFRASVWSWHPIWDFCEELVPEICGKVEHAHSNDGDGLGSRDAKIVGEAVLLAIRDGRAEKYVQERNEFLDALPNKPCIHCYGTGMRQWYTNKSGESRSKWEYNIMQEPSSVEDLLPRTANKMKADETEREEKCNGCSGSGHVRPWVASYGFDLAHLEEWGKFLVNCGGFNIY